MKELSYRKYLQCSLLVYCLDLYLLTDDTGFASQFHWTVNPFTLQRERKVWKYRSNCINKKHGSQTLLQMICLWNHTSHTKVHFNEFVANVLCDNMDMIIFDLWGCGGYYRPKTSYTHFNSSSSLSTSPAIPKIHQLSWRTTNFMGYRPLVAQCLPLVDFHYFPLTK